MKKHLGGKLGRIMKKLNNAILSAAAVAVVLSLGGCGKSEKNEGPAEKPTRPWERPSTTPVK